MLVYFVASKIRCQDNGEKSGANVVDEFITWDGTKNTQKRKTPNSSRGIFVDIRRGKLSVQLPDDNSQVNLP